MSNLGIKNTITMDLELANKGTGIFTKVVENFNNVSIFQNRFKAQRERIHFCQIEYEAPPA